MFKAELAYIEIECENSVANFYDSKHHSPILHSGKELNQPGIYNYTLAVWLQFQTQNGLLSIYLVDEIKANAELLIRGLFWMKSCDQ